MAFKKIVIVGGGINGSQIAFQISYCGFETWILLRSEASIQRAKQKIEKLRNIYLDTMEKMKTDKTAYCDGFTNKKDLTNKQIDELEIQLEKGYKELKFTTNFDEACKNADLIIEAIIEDPKQKTELYQILAKHMEKKTLLVTNSSNLLPSQLADSTGRPEKYLGFHFANQIWKNNITEIMLHSRTDKKYFEEMVKFAEEINMIPLKVNKEKNGYILNSLLIPFLISAASLWANDVSDAETIDKAWILGTGASEGPFRTLDFIGLSTAYNVLLNHPDYADPNSNIRKIGDKVKIMIDAGKLGINSGEGFYKYK